MNARLPFSLASAFAEQAATNAAVLARCTVYPWVITISYCDDQGRYTEGVHIVQSTLADMPDAAQFLPAGATFLKADVFPATRFDDMADSVRPRYRRQYSAYLLWRKAHAMGKATTDMVPWVDYDGIWLDESARRWAQPGVRYAGD